ncbi:MAG: histidine kinase [Coriobacteriales bacterium]|nr:histidine kinase [Coriobacteriales bacterium]
MWSYYIIALLMVASGAYIVVPAHDVSWLVVIALAMVCLLTARLLLQLFKAPTWLATALALMAVVVAGLFDLAMAVPLALVLVAEQLEQRIRVLFAALILGSAAALLAAILPEYRTSLMIAAIGTAAALLSGHLLQELQTARDRLAARDSQQAALQARLAAQRETISQIERQGRQAERSRLAARIHDKVGHGITGSILMLEAAQLQMDNQPDTARQSIRVAAENLRASVDGIRADLRQERDAAPQVGLPSIEEALQRFSAEHPHINTELSVEGSLTNISQAIWHCVHESLLETLTNVLKHATAERLTVKLRLAQRGPVLNVEISDNGQVPAGEQHQGLEFGIGLTAIEERCRLVGGKAFFERTPQGFRTSLTFTTRGGSER